MYNKVVLIGRLGEDPEIIQGSGLSATFPLETFQSWKNKSDGGTATSTQRHRIVASGKHVKVCNNYLKKGKMVLIEGRLETTASDDGKSRKGKDQLRYSSTVAVTFLKMFPRTTDNPKE